MYKLSVLVTFYNQINYCIEAMESILNQHLEDGSELEVLVGDDGSNDGTYELLVEKYGQLSNVRFFRQDRVEPIKEYSERRHTRLIRRLLDEVQGEYFTLLDGDDYYCDMDGFQKKISILEDETNQDCVLVGSRCFFLNDDGSLYEQPTAEVPRKMDLMRHMFNPVRVCCYMASTVVRSSVLKNLDEYVYYCDQGLIFWLLNFGDIYYHDEPSFVVRMHGDSQQAKIDQNEAVKFIEYVTGDDVFNCQFKNKYAKDFIKRDLDSHSFLFRNRGRLPELLNYDIWFEYAKKWNGWGYKFMDYTNRSFVQKMIISIQFLPWYIRYQSSEVFKKIKWNLEHVGIVVGYLFSNEYSKEEKKARLQKALGRFAGKE